MATRRIKILLIEDNARDARLVEGHLQVDGTFDVKHVTTLATAFDELRGGPTDVVLLDLELPDSFGLDTFTNLHRQFPAIPVVVLSGRDDEQLAIEAVNHGAQDYLSKWDVDTKTLTRSVRYAIERQRRMAAEQQVARTKGDFDLARRIQRHLLPAKAPRLPGFDIAGRCDPAEATGGDFFDFVTLPDGRCDLVVSDVSSHGFAPALIMAGTRRLLRTIARNHEDVAEILTLANRAVLEDTLPGQFVTMFYGRLNPASKTLTYASAGHPGFLLDKDGAASELVNPYLPLGLWDEPMRQTFTATLETANMLILMTDGIWEAQATDLSQFGRQRVFELVHQNRNKSAGEIVDLLFEAVVRFCHPRPYSDDLTLVLVKAE